MYRGHHLFFLFLFASPHLISATLGSDFASVHLLPQTHTTLGPLPAFGSIQDSRSTRTRVRLELCRHYHDEMHGCHTSVHLSHGNTEEKGAGLLGCRLILKSFHWWGKNTKVTMQEFLRKKGKGWQIRDVSELASFFFFFKVHFVKHSIESWILH